MGEQEQNKDDGGDCKVGESRGVGRPLRSREEVPTKGRALEGEANGHHDGLQPTNLSMF